MFLIWPALLADCGRTQRTCAFASESLKSKFKHSPAVKSKSQPFYLKIEITTPLLQGFLRG